MKNQAVRGCVWLVNLRICNEKSALRQQNESQQLLMSNVYGSDIRIEHRL